MKRNSLMSSWAALALAAGLSGPAHAGVLDNLLDKLEAKGVLSQNEVQEIRAEARAEEARKTAAPATGRGSDLVGEFKDGFGWESTDQRHSIGLVGRLQADYRAFSPSGTTANTADTFNIRRALLGIKGKLFNDITYELVGDFAPGAAVIDTAYMNFGWLKNAQLRTGYFTPPFSLESLTSSGALDFTERAYPSQLIAGKELGAMVHGAPVTGFTYALAVLNGSGSYNSATGYAGTETSTQKDSKDVAGRVTANFAEMAGAKNLVTHLGLAFTDGGQPAAALTGGMRTDARGATFFTGTAPAGGENFDRRRRGLELALASGPFKLQSEWVDVKFDGNGFSRGIDSYYVSGLWAITGESMVETYKNGVFGQVKPKHAFDFGGPGAWVAGLRFSRFDAGDFPTTGASFTGTRVARSTTVGLKWIPNSLTTFMFNYVRTNFDTAVGGVNAEKAANLRVQLSF